MDVNKDGQVSTQDVRDLWKVLVIWEKQQEFISKLENLRDNPEFGNILAAIQPSFETILKGNYFSLDPKNTPVKEGDLSQRESVLILQFYAKFFLGKNIPIDGNLSPELKNLHEEAIFRTRSIDDATFWDKNELEFFNKWLSMNDSITLKRVSREEFEKIWPNIATKNPWSPDGKAKPEAYTLTIPDDLKNSEIPLVIKKINEIAYGEKLPEQSAFNTFRSKLDTYIIYLESSWNNSPEYQMILSKVREMYRENYGERKPSTISKEQAKSDVEAKIGTQFQDIWNSEILAKKNDPQMKLKLIETLLSKELNQYMQLAVFERWAQTLFDHLNTITSSEMEYLLDPAKREGINYEGDLATKSRIQSAQYIEQKLKEVLNIEEYKIKLQEARAAIKWDHSSKRGKKEQILVDLEKEICNKILLEVGRYPWTEMDSSNAPSEPAKMLATKQMICSGKSIIWHTFLEELWIRHDALNIPGHIALMVHLSDGKEYVFDPTNGTELATLSHQIKLSEFMYWETTQENVFYSSAGIKLPEYKWLYTKVDAEFWLMGALYANKSYFERGKLSFETQLRLFQRAQEINPNDIQTNINLMYIYTTLHNYEKTIELGEKILKQMKSNTSSEEIIFSDSVNYVYENLLKAYYDSGKHDLVIKLGEKILQEVWKWTMQWSANLYINLAAAYGNSQDPKKYLKIWKMFENIPQQFQDNKDLLDIRILLYRHELTELVESNKYNEAIALWAKILKDYPKEKSENFWVICSNFMYAYYISEIPDKFEKMIEIGWSILENFPNQMQTRYFVSLSYISRWENYINQRNILTALLSLKDATIIANILPPNFGNDIQEKMREIIQYLKSNNLISQYQKEIWEIEKLIQQKTEKK